VRKFLLIAAVSLTFPAHAAPLPDGCSREANGSITCDDSVSDEDACGAGAVIPGICNEEPEDGATDPGAAP
jgi:hypothetical protein